MDQTSNYSSLLTSHSTFSNLHSVLGTQHRLLILLIGLPGSGKSTLAKKILAECPQMQLISTDTIRGELFGSEATQGVTVHTPPVKRN